MVSSQKIIILVLTLNLFIGFATMLASQQTNIINGELNFTERNPIILDVNNTKNKQNDMTDTTGIWGTLEKVRDSIEESTIGNAIKWGYNIASVLWEGILPIGSWKLVYNTENSTEKTLYQGLAWLQTILTLIALLEVYLIIKNKKST